jgi:hypothetical protein
MTAVSIMKGWVILSAVRSEFKEWPIRIVRGCRISRSFFWMSGSVVVTGASIFSVIPEYLKKNISGKPTTQVEKSTG